MSNYVYKESKVTTKKLAGFYDAEKATVEIEGIERYLVDELKDFEGAMVEIVVKVKEEKDLLDE
jgi:hypothetical protein